MYLWIEEVWLLAGNIDQGASTTRGRGSPLRPDEPLHHAGDPKDH